MLQGPALAPSSPQPSTLSAVPPHVPLEQGFGAALRLLQLLLSVLPSSPLPSASTRTQRQKPKVCYTYTVLLGLFTLHLVDPATSIAFPTTIRVPSKIPIPPMTLVGLGVRTVSFLGIKVYSVGFYADLNNPHLKVGPHTSATPISTCQEISLDSSAHEHR